MKAQPNKFCGVKNSCATTESGSMMLITPQNLYLGANMIKKLYSIILCLFLCSCKNMDSSASLNEDLKQSSKNSISEDIVEINAKVDISSSINGNSSLINPAWRLTKSYFPNSSSDLSWYSQAIGTLINKTQLYLSTNEGISWTKLTVNNLQFEKLDSALFDKTGQGWFIKNYIGNVQTKEYQGNSTILFTSDMGKNWKIQKVFPKTQVYGINFQNEKDGWIWGRTLNEEKGDLLFLASTTNSGTTWADISETLNKQAINEFGRVEDDVSAMYLTQDANSYILTSKGTLFSTENKGLSWKKYRSFPDRMQNSWYKVGVDLSNNLWLVGGANSREGAWRTLVTTTKDSTYKKIRISTKVEDKSNLATYFFSDIDRLTDGKWLAAGHIVKGEKRFGTIWKSDNNGDNWKIEYCTPNIDSFIKIRLFDNEKVFVTGINGETLKATLATLIKP